MIPTEAGGVVERVAGKNVGLPCEIRARCLVDLIGKIQSMAELMEEHVALKKELGEL